MIPRTIAPVLLLVAAAAAAPEVRETDRFRVEAEGSPAEAEEIARLLEAAHAEIAAHLKAKLPVAKGDRILVQVFGAKEPYRAAAAEAGAAGDAPAFAAPAQRRIGVLRQEGRYATRALLLREIARLHYELARAKGRPSAAPWYREGLAEFLAGHSWDGRTLRMGIVPDVSPDDLPGLALAESGAAGFDLAAAVEGTSPASRALAWALYGHLATGDKGKPLGGLDKFAPKMDGGVKAAPLFWQCFGKPAEYGPALATWLAVSQQPFLPIAGDWEGLGEGRVRGASKALGACRLHAADAEMKATILAPKGKERWRAGAVLGYAGETDYALFLVDWAGYLNIFRLVEGRQNVIEQGPGPGPAADGAYRFHLFRKKGQIYLMFEGGAAYGPWELPGAGFGLAVEGCDLVFGDLSWK